MIVISPVITMNCDYTCRTERLMLNWQRVGIEDRWWIKEGVRLIRTWGIGHQKYGSGYKSKSTKSNFRKWLIIEIHEIRCL